MKLITYNPNGVRYFVKRKLLPVIIGDDGRITPGNHHFVYVDRKGFETEYDFYAYLIKHELVGIRVKF